jgi:NADH:ubiquinone oxidoreductase subunit
MDIVTSLLTVFNGTQVGSDSAGNRYFIERRARANGAPLRRWVVHPRAATASSIPPGWNAWLHFTRGGALAEASHGGGT